MKHILLKLAVISSLTISTNASAVWSIKSLEGLNVAYDINNSGVVVGANGDMSVLFDPEVGGIVNLGIGWAFDINDLGQAVVTNTYPAGLTASSYSYITDSNSTILANLAGTNAIAINNSGQVAGGVIHSGQTEAFYTGPNGTGMTYLGTLGGTFSFAGGINDSGQVTGESYIADNTAFHAFISDPGTAAMIDLGTLGGTNSFASEINNSGQVVGKSDTANGERAFITGPDGVGMTDLGSMGADYSVAFGVNNLGQVVGSASFEGCSALACYNTFIYSNDVMVNVSKLPEVIDAGWTFLFAEDINDKGQIVGYGILNGIYQGFILSGADDEEFFNSYVETPMINPYIPAIPEPTLYTMLLAGLGLLGFMARRRKESAA